MPPPKPMATWDNATSKAPAKLTAEQEEAAVFNQDSNWAKCNGLVVIAAALPGNRELGRGAEWAKTSMAKNYYQSLIKDYSNLPEQQKNSDEGPLTDPMPAIAAHQDSNSQNRCLASQMDDEVDSKQVAPVRISASEAREELARKKKKEDLLKT
ncbi:hypothetical protein IW147_000645 [Coemansia sp. RSA 720]|nr:hypothetical protein IW147_000645 [Coemansia sp. RSA 720]